MGVNDHDTFTGLTPLHKAAADGRLEDVIALMDDGADVDIQANGEVGRGEMRTTRAREGEREGNISYRSGDARDRVANGRMRVDARVRAARSRSLGLGDAKPSFAHGAREERETDDEGRLWNARAIEQQREDRGDVCGERWAR